MYTGIVQAVRPLLDVTSYPGHRQFTLDLTPELLDDLKIGASVSVEGTCLSVTEIDGTEVKFDAMNATLERTNLRSFKAGQGVNVERSAKMNAEVGGHLMAGHERGSWSQLHRRHLQSSGLATAARDLPDYPTL